MGVRSSIITRLPAELRKEVDRRLIAADFTGYRGLVRWIGEQGYRVSLAALHGYGRNFKRRLRIAAAAADEVFGWRELAQGDRERAEELSVRSLQARIFDVLVELEGPMSPVHLARLGKAIGDWGLSGMRRKVWAAELRERLAAQQAGAMQRLKQLREQGELSAEAAELVMAIVAGIDPLME